VRAAHPIAMRTTRGMKLSIRTRAGHGLALLGGVLMMLGGIADLSIRNLLPSHLAFLGMTSADVPAATETMLLALLHALGSALVASGLAVLVLLRQAWITGHRLPALAAVAVAVLAEGTNAFGLYLVGSALFVAPLGLLLLVSVGVVLCLLPRWELGSRSSQVDATAPSG
jgi:hypothetical protein